jgi:hypothetical protein
VIGSIRCQSCSLQTLRTGAISYSTADVSFITPQMFFLKTFITVYNHLKNAPKGSFQFSKTACTDFYTAQQVLQTI